MRKTFKDCAICKYVSCCDAHIANGTHKHTEGVDPCELDVTSRKSKFTEPKMKRSEFNKKE